MAFHTRARALPGAGPARSLALTVAPLGQSPPDRGPAGPERPPLACFFNDAGVGKEGAGVAGLALLQPRGTVAATYSHDSARIGDAADGAASGIITHLNAAATAAGLAEGMRVADAVAALGASAS